MSFKPQNFTIWMEIPVSDLEKSVEYYNTVCETGMSIDTTGPNPMAVFPTEGGPSGGVAGHLYPGKPPARGTGPTIHIAVPDSLEAAMKRVEAAGGEVKSEPIPLPMGRLPTPTTPMAIPSVCTSKADAPR